ncbi:putative kinesin 3D isoform X2 [Penaeus vannamei]|uniref:Putative kinesin 3D isoform X2 n=1 Tax=Penaeus vannamei TaxID=6689 RepID=A0A423TZ15_PENVA|nr:putative kinesin 3D isoform X2 [Penaeus vannamei]
MKKQGKTKKMDTMLKDPLIFHLDSSLLQEDRLALLIEREVQRRVLEEVVARESAALSSRTNPRRNYRSMSTSVDPWNLGLRVLTPSEVRPYTSMSAGYEMEGEVGNHLYQSATSADDLLLTPAPLQSPMTDYDMSCGICVCIPGYEMRGAGSAAHWEYEVKIAAGNDSWTVFRDTDDSGSFICTCVTNMANLWKNFTFHHGGYLATSQKGL